MANYVDLVNKAIDESGCDLAQYSSSGSDFTTNTEPMLRRFKTWVARSTRQVQQMVYDWHFLNNQAMVTVQPGLLFYSQGAIPGVFAPTMNIYGTDDQVLFSNVPVTGIKDLTYTQYSNDVTESFGYVDLQATYDDPLVNISFKAGGDYFRLFNRTYIVSSNFSGTPENQRFYQTGTQTGAVLSFLVTNAAETSLIGVFDNVATLETITPDVQTGLAGSDGYTFSTTNAALIAAIDSGDYIMYLYNAPVDLPPGWVVGDPPPALWAAYSSSGDNTSLDYVNDYAKAFLHSWKSFDFSEEVADGDYQGEICKINPTTFQYIDHGQPSPSVQRPLIWVPWNTFLQRLDWLCGPPGTPTYITQDNTGRWRLYPHPDQPVTLKFEFSRVPQELVNYDDVVKGIPSDFHELIMWLAIRYYGEYDEQPSVARRADRYYKDLLQRLMMVYRPKLRIVPARLW